MKTGRCLVLNYFSIFSKPYTITFSNFDQTIPVPKSLVDIYHPEAEKITLIYDNLNTHVLYALYETFEPQEAKRILDKLDIHYTPKHGSWLNMAEIELSVLSRQCLARRIPDKETLNNEIAAWEKHRNEQLRTIDWQFTTDDARIKLKRLYPSVLP
jgi:hypothetical protein